MIIRLDPSATVFHCGSCPKRLRKYTAAIKHYQSEHNLSAGLGCSECELAFGTLTCLEMHRHSVHNITDPMNTCVICSLPFYTKMRQNIKFGAYKIQHYHLRISPHRLERHIKSEHPANFAVCFCSTCKMRLPNQVG